MARRILVAEREDNGAYTLSERPESSGKEPAPVTIALSRRAIFEFVDFGAHEAVGVREGAETTYFVLLFRFQPLTSSPPRTGPASRSGPRRV